MRRIPLLALSACLLGVMARAANPRLLSQETARLRLVYYSPTHAYIVPHLIRSFENAYAFHRKLFDYRTWEKVSVLFQDFYDMSHGGASPLPRNFLSIAIAPPNHVFETTMANERFNLLMNHELTHIVTTDQATGRDLFFRRFFGGKVNITADDPISMGFSFLTNPRFYSPRWYHEGMAVFMETWMGGGLGRALGGYDEMVFRAKVRDGAYIYDPLGLESEGTSIDFQVGANSYLYGTRFVTWMAQRHGTDKLLGWIRRVPGSRAYFSSQFRKNYGTSIRREWANWISAERANGSAPTWNGSVSTR